MAHRVCHAHYASPDTVLPGAADMRTASCRFPGGLKQRTAQEQFAKDPSSILREAVLGMLPKNNLRKVSLQAPTELPSPAGDTFIALTELLCFVLVLRSMSEQVQSCFAGSRPEVEDLPVR